MHFKVEHRYRGISLKDFETLYFDESFNEAQCKAVKLQRTLVKRALAGGKLHREVKVAPDREIPPAAQKILGGARIEYTEHLDYGVGTWRGTWSTISSLLTDKVKSQGSFSFRQEGGDVIRSLEGDVDVKIMIVGSVVEKFIIADVEKSYQQANDFGQAWILAKKPVGESLG